MDSAAEPVVFRRDLKPCFTALLWYIFFFVLCVLGVRWGLYVRTPAGIATTIVCSLTGLYCAFVGYTSWMGDRNTLVSIVDNQIQMSSYNRVIVSGSLQEILKLEIIQYPGRRLPSLWIVRFDNGKQFSFPPAILERERLIKLIEEGSGRSFVDAV